MLQKRIKEDFFRNHSFEMIKRIGSMYEYHKYSEKSFFFFYRSLKSQLRWAGYVPRMGNHRQPKTALYSKLSTCDRNRGVPNQRFKDSVKKTLGTCHIDHHQWSTLVANRQAWHRTVHQVVSTLEDSRRANFYWVIRTFKVFQNLTDLPCLGY